MKADGQILPANPRLRLLFLRQPQGDSKVLVCNPRWVREGEVESLGMSLGHPDSPCR